MYYIFPYARCVVVELRKDNPGGQARVAPALGLPQPLLAQIWAGAVALDPAPHRVAALARRWPTISTSIFSARDWCASCATTRPGRTPSTSTIRATRAPTNTSSACGRSAKAASSRSSRSIAISARLTPSARAIAATCRASAIRSRADRNALLSYCWDGATLSIDPASTGGKEWEDFLRAYNDFCSARGGEPLFNQTPFLTKEQAQKAFGGRLKLFADYRRQADPENRLLDSLFPRFPVVAAIGPFVVAARISNIGFIKIPCAW